MDEEAPLVAATAAARALLSKKFAIGFQGQEGLKSAEAITEGGDADEDGYFVKKTRFNERERAQ